MKNFNFKKFLVAALIAAVVAVPALFTTGCSTSWITEAEAIVTEAVPIATSIIQLVAILGNSTISQSDVNLITQYSGQVNADFNLVGTLLTGYNSANALTTEQKINAALADAQTNLNQILTATHITDPATVAKINAAVGIIQAEIQAAENLVPHNQTATLLQGTSRASRLLTARQFHTAYAATFNAPTGSVVVDAAVKRVAFKAPHFWQTK